jgi:hypothetical protein
MSRAFLIVLLAAHFFGCASSSKTKRAKRAVAVPQPMLVGTIMVVNAVQNFVLIDSTNSPGPLPDAALTTRSPDGAVAELKASPIRRRPFAIADVIKGEPKVGDEVFQLPK